MDADLPSTRAVAIQVYRRLINDPYTAPAAFGIAAMVIRNALGCPLGVACALLDDWLKEERL